MTRREIQQSSTTIVLALRPYTRIHFFILYTYKAKHSYLETVSLKWPACKSTWFPAMLTTPRLGCPILGIVILDSGKT